MPTMCLKSLNFVALKLIFYTHARLDTFLAASQITKNINKILYVKFWRRYVGRKRVNLYLIGLKATIHAFNKSGRHLEFPMNDVIRGKIIHVAKMATKDESSVDVDFAVCSYKKDCFYFIISRGIFSLYNVFFGYVIETLKLSCKDIPGSMISRANEC